MAGPDSPTFRLRRVPAFVDRAGLVQFLLSTVEGIGSPENLRVFSFAPTPGDWSKPSSQTATLQFIEVPARFSRSQGENEWPVAVPGQKLPLIFDVHFLDFTPLNRVEDEVHDFDFIAISGLASHPFGSWRKHASTSTADQRPWSFMWLRDQLPLDFPRARIMTYGYDTTLLKSSSFQTIDHIAQFFIAKLKSIGKAQTFTRPVVFLAHSLGGIILKRALCYLADSGAAEDFMLQQVRMVIFFGVPSKGMKMSYMLPMVDGQPNKQLVEALSDSPQNEFLSWLNNSFRGIALFRHLRLVSAFETQLTITFVESRPGKWERKGEQVVLVKPESAIQLGTQTPQDTFQIDRNHSDIVKFSEDDLSYSIVANYIREATEPQANDGSQPSISLRQSSGIAGRSSSTLFSVRNLLAKIIGIPFQAMRGRAPITSLDGSTSKQHPGSLNMDQSCVLVDTKSPGKAAAQAEQNLDDETQQVQSSLDFQERQDRFDQIEPAYQGTLDWLYERQTDLSTWIENGAGIYWIRGKAGSGKSILMKSLHQSMSEKLAQEEYKSSSSKANIWFFFHERGSYLQNSFEGLLRATIVQMMRKEVRLAEMAAKFYVTKDQKIRDIWTMEDLNHIFAIFLEQSIVDIDATLFIDALDEFSGFPEVVADFLATVALRPQATARTRIRICFSSRPWAAFLELFDKCPGFLLEDYTRQDIHIYSKSRLCEIGSIAAALIKDSQSSVENLEHAKNLVDSITARAEGVFLWVRLVVDRLVAGGNVSLESLEATLADLPDQLEDYYAMTLDRIPLRDRLTSFIILEIVFRSQRTLPLNTLFSILSCAEADNFHECQTILHRYHISQPSFEQMALQLKNFCGGLLELLQMGRSSVPSIQFIHRTVKDYIGQPGFKQRMLKSAHAKLSENGYCFIVKYEFATHESNWDSVEDVLATCNLAETSTGNHLGRFLDTVPDSIFVQPPRLGNLFPPSPNDPFPPFNSRLSFAVVADLRLYIEARIAASSPKLLVNSNEERSLLHCAVQKTTQAAKLNDYYREQADLADMVRLLLQSGANTDALYHDMTPFETLFSDCFEGFGGHGGSKISQSMINVADAFLEAGQNINIQLKPDNLISVRPRTRGHHYRKGSFVCSPLHVSHGDMTRVLLDHGANVNALDSEGLTPLDICIGAVGSILEIGETRLPSEALQTTRLLVTRGGCLSQGGYSYFFESEGGYHARLLRETFPELVSLVERAPILKETAKEGKFGRRFRFASTRKSSRNDV